MTPTLHPVKPCRKCGAADRLPPPRGQSTGRCRPCLQRYVHNKHKPLLTRPCEKCGEVNRHTSGQCKTCEKRAGARRAQRQAVCAACGAADRNASGNCRPCTAANAQRSLAVNAAAPCRRCGESERGKGGVCLACSRKYQSKSHLRSGPCGTCGSHDRRPSGACRQCSAEHDRRYRSSKPLVARAKTAKRRKRALKSAAHYRAEDVHTRKRLQRGRCWWCGERVGADYHVDHIIPLAQNGSNGPENICISCPSCNLSKGAKMPWDFQEGRLF